MNELITVDNVQKEQEEFVNAIVEAKGANLPAKVEEVLQIFEFTDWKAKAWKTLADKMERLEDQSEAYHSALRSGQQWGIAALYAQKRMGEITREMPIKRAGRLSSEDRLAEEGKTEKLKNNGISRDTYADAERIAAHPEILDRVIESSKERGEIPTKTAVLNTIKAEKNKLYNEQQKEKHQEKIAKSIPKIVADHYEWVKLSKLHLDLVIAGSKHGKFDPAGKNFMIKKHDEIRNKLKEAEEAIQ